MKHYKLLTIVAAAMLNVGTSMAEEAPLWLRGAAISPEGKRVAFTYMGDIYSVSAEGGVAIPLTTHQAYDASPFWSPDGRHIAFTSEREGGLDIYVMDANGDNIRRLTYHSANERPLGWADNETILFSRTGLPTVSDLVFPGSTFSHVYSVNIKGGRQHLWSELTMGDLSINAKGQVLYNNIKGYEDPWRKHHTSSITRDVWLRDGEAYTRLTDFKGEDRNPQWAADGQSYYYLSEQDGTLNVYHRQVGSGTEQQLTHYTGNPVRYLSVAQDGTLCYCYDGEIYLQQGNAAGRKLRIVIHHDAPSTELKRSITYSGAQSVKVSPKGKEIAFIMNNDVYVTNLEYNTTKQITDTPGRERTVDFAEDGRTLVYDSERDGVWSIYKTTIKNKDEKDFAYSTELTEECLTDGETTSFQPAISPDGKLIAYLQDRTTLCVMTIDGKKSHVVMDGKYQYSYSDGDQHFAWSPDSKWLLTEYLGTGGWCIGDIALVRADGKGTLVNLTNSGYSDSNPRWVLGGKAMLFGSDRAGYRSHGSWGAESDVYIMFFDNDAYENFRMNREELALKEEAEKGKKKEKDSAEVEQSKELKFDLDNLDARTIRLTPSSGNMGDAVMDEKGEKLYYTCTFQNQPALFVQDLKEYNNELKIRNLSYGSMNLSNDGKKVYLIGNGGIKELNLADTRTKDISFEAFVTNRWYETQQNYFEHIWRQTREKLYDPAMNGADWERLYATYSRFLPHINNGWDFAEMASELLGELNVSHTGCRYYGSSASLSTAELGVLYDEGYHGQGLRIAEVVTGSPLSVKQDVHAGQYVTHIDGVEVGENTDIYPLLNGRIGRYTRVTIANKPGGKGTDYTIRPISMSSMQDLLYKRWVKRNEHLVDSISGGRLAYVHIESMDAGSFHELYKNLLSDSNRQREAAIVDTRHNGGGWLHNDVCTLLSGKLSVKYTPRGQYIGNDPYNRWVKPSCMLVCEDNYSNAHGTPWLYKELGIGKLVGAPVAGTMTAVWWDRIGPYVFGIPQVGSLDNRGQYLENQDLVPDVEVYTSPEDQLRGRDQQLEAAVKLMLGQ